MDLLLCFCMSKFNTSSTNDWTLSFLVRIFVKYYFAIDSWVFPLASQLHLSVCLFPCWFFFLLVCCWKLQSLCPVVYLYLLVYNIFFSITIFRKKYYLVPAVGTMKMPYWWAYCWHVFLRVHSPASRQNQ